VVVYVFVNIFLNVGIFKLFHISILDQCSVDYLSDILCLCVMLLNVEVVIIVSRFSSTGLGAARHRKDP